MGNNHQAVRHLRSRKGRRPNRYKPKTQNKYTPVREPPNAGARQDAETQEDPQNNWGE